MEEFYLQPAEIALAPRVIGAAALSGHRPDQAVLIAYPYPFRPAVMAAAVRVDLGMVALAEPLARAEQRRVAISACGEVSYLLLPGCNLFVGIKQLVNLPSSCRFLILLFQRGWENNDGF